MERYLRAAKAEFGKAQDKSEALFAIAELLFARMHVSPADAKIPVEACICGVESAEAVLHGRIALPVRAEHPAKSSQISIELQMRRDSYTRLEERLLEICPDETLTRSTVRQFRNKRLKQLRRLVVA